MDKFDRFLSLSFEEYGEYFIDESEIDDTPHIFSAEFEQKMELLLNNKTHRSIKVTPRLLMSILIAAILAAMSATVTVSAVHERLSELYLTDSDNKRFTVLNIKQPEQYGERNYGQGYFLRENNYGFELIFHEDTTQDNIPFYFSYRRSLYENDYAILEIWEGAPTSESSLAVLNDEDNELLQINGNDVYFTNYTNIEKYESGLYDDSYYYPENSGMTLVWDDGGHFVELSIKNKDNGNYTKNDIINLFDFVYKVE